MRAAIRSVLIHGAIPCTTPATFLTVSVETKFRILSTMITTRIVTNTRIAPHPWLRSPKSCPFIIFRKPLSSEQSKPILHYEWVGEPFVPHPRGEEINVFLHGLLGSGRNLRSFAKAFCKQHQKGILMDLPGHGKSRHITVNSLADCINAVQNTIQHAGIVHRDQSWILIGHSIGGRLALHYTDYALHNDYDQETGTSSSATDEANVVMMPQPRRLILLDTVPGGAQPQVLHVIAAVQEIEEQMKQGILHFKSRQDLTRHLIQLYHIDQGTAQWLASSFADQKANGNGQIFGFDITTAHKLIQYCIDEHFVDRLDRIIRGQHPTLQVIDLVRGGLNQHWTDKDITQLQKLQSGAESRSDSSSLQFRFHLLPTAAHWVHVDDLGGLLRVLEG